MDSFDRLNRLVLRFAPGNSFRISGQVLGRREMGRWGPPFVETETTTDPAAIRVTKCPGHSSSSANALSGYGSN